MVLMKIIKKQLNGLLNLIKIMSRKINVRSPFYLFVDDSGLTDSSTTSTTTTTNGGTTTTTTTAAPGTTFGCPTLTGGGIAQNGSITDPTPSAGTIVGKSESYQGALITSVSSNHNTYNVNKTLYFKIQVPTNSNYTNSGDYIWCSKQFQQQTTTQATTTQSTSLPLYTCSIASLSGGSASANGTVTYPSVTGGQIVGFSLSNQGTLIQNLSSNTSTSDSNKALWWKILPNSNYSNQGQAVWCQHTIVQSYTTTTQATTTADPYNYYFIRGCSGTNYSNQDMVIRTSSTLTTSGTGSSGSYTTLSMYGSCWYPYDTATASEYTSNAGDLNSSTYTGTITQSSNCSTCTGAGNTTTTTTTTTTQSQQYTEFYISAGRNSLSDFCNTGSSVQNIVSVPGLNKTYSNSLNSYVYTINNGNATIFNGSNKWFLVNNSPMNFAGSGSFNYWEITPQGQIVSSGTYTSCTGNNNGAGNEY